MDTVNSAKRNKYLMPVIIGLLVALIAFILFTKLNKAGDTSPSPGSGVDTTRVNPIPPDSLHH